MTRFTLFFSTLSLLLLAGGSTAFAAGPDITDVSSNLVESVYMMPALIAGICYLLGLLFGVTGILKLKAHVENSTQTPLRTPVIRFLIGGSLFALPTIYDAMGRAISGGVAGSASEQGGGFMSGLFGFSTGIMNSANNFLNSISGGLLGGLFNMPVDLNSAFQSVLSSIEGVPALILAFAYLLGLLLGAQGLIKIKDHVENPDQTSMREGIINLLIGGAFLSIGTIYAAMQVTVSNGNPSGDSHGSGFLGSIGNILDDIGGIFGLYESEYDDASCMGGALGNLIGDLSLGILGPDEKGATLGTAFCNIINNAGTMPSLLMALAYIFGLVLGFLGLLKIRDHVLEPQKTPLWDGIIRLVAGGAFFSMPFVTAMIKNTLGPSDANFDNATTGYTDSELAGCGGSGGIIDTVIDWLSPDTNRDGQGLGANIYCAMTDVMGPLHVALNFFAVMAGTILIMIGISRLLKGMQDGPRGPGGIGTMMTFVTGGMLISYNHFMRMFTATIFGTPTTATKVSMANYGGISPEELQHTHLVIGAILKFMIIIGLISFVRGIFIVRGVAEGNNQASMMAGMTHMIGGALAVNLGPLLNLIQMTLGISTNMQITFS